MTEPRGYGRGPRFTCPGCRKKGVTFRFGARGEDAYVCRYCQFSVFTSGYDTQDVAGRVALAQANPRDKATILSELDLTLDNSAPTP